ncbi:MAG: hypothetical protein V4722_17305 [Bacteroidota bacterium]
MNDDFNFQHGDIAGAIAVKLANNLTLDDFCEQHVADYNRDRFEAIAIRLFLGKETVITVYAVDKLRQEDGALNPEKLPVKKFKLTTIPANELLSYCESFNFTLSTGTYHVEDMEVINR